MSERFSSGDRRSDSVLGGGLPANALNMIIGLPGSGKTILAEQFLFHNASAQRPGVYLSTVSEPLEKILAHLVLDRPKCALGNAVRRALESAEGFRICLHENSGSARILLQ